MDNALTLTIEQREGEQLLSKLVLQYPALPNAQANAITLDFVDAVAAVVRGYAAAKTTGGAPELVKIIRGKLRGA